MASSSPLEGAQEMQQMLVSYAKQETVEPLKSLGKFLAFGLAGALMVFLGSCFLALGVLRLVQSETGSTFAGGSWASTVPYLVTIAALAAIMVFIFLLFNRAKKKVLS